MIRREVDAAIHIVDDLGKEAGQGVENDRVRGETQVDDGPGGGC